MISIDEHERLMNAELQKAEKQAHDKLLMLQSQMENHMTKLFEERITDTHNQMQHQFKDMVARLTQDKE